MRERIKYFTMIMAMRVTVIMALAMVEILAKEAISFMKLMGIMMRRATRR